MELPSFLTPDVVGTIRLSGHRVRLIDVAGRYAEGYSAEAIVLDHYPTVPLATAHKVIAFYLENEAAVDALIEENRVAGDANRAAQPPGAVPTLTEVRRRMAERRAVGAV